MTKKDAALELLGLGLTIHREATDADAAVWIYALLSVARRLDPSIEQHPRYSRLLFADTADSKQAKLRRLIEHPATPSAEREAAVSALARIRKVASDDLVALA